MSSRRTRRKLAFVAGMALALVVVGFLIYVTNPIVVPPSAQASTTGQHTTCKGRAIHVVQTLVICKQTDYMIQPDGHGIWVIATHVKVVKGCSLLAGTGGRITNVVVTTTYLTFPYWPVAQERLGTQYRCTKHWAVGIPGPESGPARVVTNMHVRIRAANDWNPAFGETLRRP